MSNWVGGLPPQEDKKKAKKAAKPASPRDGGHLKTFFGGAIPPIPLKLPKYKKEDPPPKVKITGAGPPIKRDPPASEPKAPAPSPPPASPPTPAPPPPPPPSRVSESTPQSYSLPPLPKRFPSVFDRKPKKKRKKKKKKKPPPPPPPKPVECCDDDDVCGEQGQEDLGRLPSIFAICHIPATRQGLEDDYGGYGEKEDRSGLASPRSGEEDEGLDVPPAVPSYMRPDAFAGIFGKKIDARNLAEVGPHGWYPTANAPLDVTDTGDTVAVGPSGWHEARSE